MKTDTITKTDGVLDWAETLLCNAVPPAHCSREEWRKLLAEWRAAKHGVRWCKTHNREATSEHNGKPRCDPALGGIAAPCDTSANWNAEHPVVVRLSEVAYEAERLKEKLARIRALLPYMREPEEQMLHRVLHDNAKDEPRAKLVGSGVWLAIKVLSNP